MSHFRDTCRQREPIHGALWLGGPQQRVVNPYPLTLSSGGPWDRGNPYPRRSRRGGWRGKLGLTSEPPPRRPCGARAAKGGGWHPDPSIRPRSTVMLAPSSPERTLAPAATRRAATACPIEEPFPPACAAGAWRAGRVALQASVGRGGVGSRFSVPSIVARSRRPFPNEGPAIP
jgi:hypothetical protein